MPDEVSNFFLDVRYYNPSSTEKDKLSFLPSGIKLKLMQHNTILKDEVLSEAVRMECVKLWLTADKDNSVILEKSDKTSWQIQLVKTISTIDTFHFLSVCLRVIDGPTEHDGYPLLSFWCLYPEMTQAP